jgi:hypothetical protein
MTPLQQVNVTVELCGVRHLIRVTEESLLIKDVKEELV